MKLKGRAVEWQVVIRVYEPARIFDVDDDEVVLCRARDELGLVERELQLHVVFSEVSHVPGETHVIILIERTCIDLDFY